MQDVLKISPYDNVAVALHPLNKGSNSRRFKLSIFLSTQAISELLLVVETLVFHF